MLSAERTNEGRILFYGWWWMQAGERGRDEARRMIYRYVYICGNHFYPLLETSMEPSGRGIDFKNTWILWTS